MKIFSAAQLRDCDNYTKKALGINSLELIKKAATACAHSLMAKYNSQSPFLLICGMGNNGADGLALAQILLENNYSVRVWQVQHRELASPENKTLLNKILSINARLVDYINPGFTIPELPKNIVVVDAILGTGTHKIVEDWLADFFAQINQLPHYKIAIDLPSGLSPDHIFNSKSNAIIAVQETLCLHGYKRTMLHPETAKFCGHIQVLDIGLVSDCIPSENCPNQTLEARVLQGLVKVKSDFSYKNEHGHVVIVGGSKGKTGAAIMATKAALRSGVGLVSSIIPQECYLPIQFQAPEAMCSTSGLEQIDHIISVEGASAIGIGVGMGIHIHTVKAFTAFIKQCTLPCVLDADALNILALNPELMEYIPQNSVLTPHVGECNRLFGKKENSLEQVEDLRKQAMLYKVCIVLKGHRTIVLSPNGSCFYNLSGNPGMAKGGSGDVLTGLLSGLLAQAYPSEQAAQLAVYLHGLSGDSAAASLGQQAMNAGDIINQLPNAWQKLAKT